MLLLQEPDSSRDSWFSKLPHTEHGTRERTGREAFPAEHRNARAPHMNQRLAAATAAREDQITAPDTHNNTRKTQTQPLTYTQTPHTLTVDHVDLSM